MQTGYETFVRTVLQSDAIVHPGIVHQGIDPAELFQSKFDHFFTLFGLG